MILTISIAMREISNYIRQVIIPEVGYVGQLKIASSSVLVVGVGGIGSPLVIYLASMGIGRIGLVDYDLVSIHDLHRQIIFSVRDVGKRKVDVAKSFLNARYPELDVVVYPKRIEEIELRNLLGKWDVVADCTDNVDTRYFLNEQCFLAGMPLSFGAAETFLGYSIFFDFTQESPCLNCVFKKPPADCPLGDCSVMGIAPYVTGVVGTLQAGDIFKYLIGIEKVSGVLKIVDERGCRTVPFYKDPECTVCSQLKREDKDRFSKNSPQYIEVEEAKSICRQRKAVVVDLSREAIACKFFDDTFPMKIESLLDDYLCIPKDKEILVCCETGVKAHVAAQFLISKGYRA